MEKSVTLRFYDVTRSNDRRPPFADVLRAVAAKQISEREARVGPDEILVRLEDFAEENGQITGQFIRGQSGNRPGRMLAEGTGNLPFREPLGHGIAFLYRVQDGLLAVQFDAKILSPGRILDYLYEHEPAAEYILTPRMRDDAWERFEELPLRKFEVAVAGAANPHDLDNDENPVWHNVARMKRAYGANVVRFEISMGHSRGALAEAGKTFVREAFHRYQNGEDDIRAIRGVLDPGNGEPKDPVDLLGTLLDVKEKLHFDEDDFPRFYQLRRELLQSKVRGI